MSWSDEDDVLAPLREPVDRIIASALRERLGELKFNVIVENKIIYIRASVEDLSIKFPLRDMIINAEKHHAWISEVASRLEAISEEANSVAAKGQLIAECAAAIKTNRGRIENTARNRWNDLPTRARSEIIGDYVRGDGASAWKKEPYSYWMTMHYTFKFDDLPNFFKQHLIKLVEEK